MTPSISELPLDPNRGWRDRGSSGPGWAADKPTRRPTPYRRLHDEGQDPYPSDRHNSCISERLPLIPHRSDHPWDRARGREKWSDLNALTRTVISPVPCPFSRPLTCHNWATP